MLVSIMLFVMAIVFFVGFVASVLDARRESGISIEWGAAVLCALCAIAFMLI